VLMLWCAYVVVCLCCGVPMLWFAYVVVCLCCGNCKKASDAAMSELGTVTCSK